MPALTDADVLDVCHVMLERAGLSLAQLARHMGVVLPVAGPGVAGPTAVLAPGDGGRQGLVLRAADQPDGVCAADLRRALSLSEVSVWAITAAMCTAGVLHRRKARGERAHRFFADPLVGDAWVRRHEQALTDAYLLRVPAPASQRQARPSVPRAPRAPRVLADAAALPPAPRRGPGSSGKPGAQLVAPPRGTAASEPAPHPRAAVEVITPPGVVPRVYPAPPGRFEPRQGEQLSGGFSRCRPGIDPLTGAPW